MLHWHPLAFCAFHDDVQDDSETKHVQKLLFNIEHWFGCQGIHGNGNWTLEGLIDNKIQNGSHFKRKQDNSIFTPLDWWLWFQMLCFPGEIIIIMVDLIFERRNKITIKNVCYIKQTNIQDPFIYQFRYYKDNKCRYKWRKYIYF
jgi:hypothetical protein